MTTLFANFLAGTTTDSPLTSGATTINSSAFANLPVVTGGDVMWLVLDPDASAGAPEIVQVTAHSSSATSVTVSRAQQSTSAREHASGTVWRAVVTKSDMDTLMAFLEDGAIGYTNLGNTASFTRTTNIAVGSGGNGAVTFETESNDTDGWWSSGTTFTCPESGLYTISAWAKLSSSTGTVRLAFDPSWIIGSITGGVDAPGSNYAAHIDRTLYIESGASFELDYAEVSQLGGTATIDTVRLFITRLA